MEWTFEEERVAQRKKICRKDAYGVTQSRDGMGKTHGEEQIFGLVTFDQLLYD